MSQSTKVEGTSFRIVLTRAGERIQSPSFDLTPAGYAGSRTWLRKYDVRSLRNRLYATPDQVADNILPDTGAKTWSSRRGGSVNTTTLD